MTMNHLFHLDSKTRSKDLKLGYLVTVVILSLTSNVTEQEFLTKVQNLHRTACQQLAANKTHIFSSIFTTNHNNSRLRRRVDILHRRRRLWRARVCERRQSSSGETPVVCEEIQRLTRGTRSWRRKQGEAKRRNCVLVKHLIPSPRDDYA